MCSHALTKDIPVQDILSNKQEKCAITEQRPSARKPIHFMRGMVPNGICQGSQLTLSLTSRVASNSSDFTSQTKIFTSYSFTNSFNEKGSEGYQTFFSRCVIKITESSSKINRGKTWLI